MPPFALAAVFAAVTGCSACKEPATPAPGISVAPDAGPWRAPPGALCHRQYAGVPSTPGVLQDPALVETSGVVASRSQPGVLWMHNDSGDDSRVFAVGVQGEALGRLTFADEDLGDRAFADLEDLAYAPCPDGSGPCLWLADVGNNGRDRDDLTLYVVAEPRVSASEPLGEARGEVRLRIPVRYPTDPVDAEALLVDIDGQSLLLIEKVEGATARLYGLRAPFVDGEPRTLELVGVLPNPAPSSVEHARKITAADLHPTGRAIALRTYSGIFELRLADDQTLFDLDEAQAAVVTFGPLSEPQGEAIAYDEDALGIWTVSEDRDRAPGQPLHHFACE